MAFDFDNRFPNSGGGSAFDDGPSVPKRPQRKGGGFQIPSRDRNDRSYDAGRTESSREQTGRELQNRRTSMLDNRGSRGRSGGYRSGAPVDIPWTAIIYILMAILVVVLLVVFWDVIYALMVNILSFLLMLIIFIAILRFLLRK